MEAAQKGRRSKRKPCPPGLSLTDKAALITGASGEIGGAIARCFAEAGASVAVVGFHNESALKRLTRRIRSIKGRVLPLVLDLREAEQCDKAVADTIESFARLDVLVNCAGIVNDKLFVKTADADWQDIMATNVSGAFALARSAARVMIRQRSGTIVNISSVASSVPAAGQAAYAASKGALESLTRALAVELGPKGIRVNAVAPGRIRSPMAEQANKREGDRLLRRIPLRRYGAAREVAEAALFLASDCASYMTGQVVTLDGGLSLAAKG